MVRKKGMIEELNYDCVSQEVGDEVVFQQGIERRMEDLEGKISNLCDKMNEVIRQENKLTDALTA